MVSTAQKEKSVSDTPAGGSQRNASTSMASGGTAFSVYKPGQGAYVRWGTAAGLGLLSVGLAGFIRGSVLMRITSNEVALNLIPVGVLVVAGWLIFRYIGKHRRVCEFLIATEGEMKKVNWSTFEEVRNATRVVIFVVILLALGLFLVDLVFMFLLNAIGVLQVGPFSGTGS